MDIEGHAQLKSANLDIALLQNVEERYLDAGLQIGEFVEHKNAAVGAGNHAVMEHTLIGIREFQGGGFDGVDIANQIGNVHIGRGQFLKKSG